MNRLKSQIKVLIHAVVITGLFLGPDLFAAQPFPFQNILFPGTDIYKIADFIRTNKTPGGMPLSYRATEGYWKSDKELSLQTVEGVMERLITKHSVSIYDAALWQISLSIVNGPQDQKTAYDFTDRLLSGSSGGLDNIRAYGRDFKYGEKKAVFKKADSYFFSIIADEYFQADPLDGNTQLEGFPTFSALHHEDWKPITGEQAWAAMIGPLQSAYLKYDGHIPPDASEIKLAKSVLPAVEAMQSGIGGIYHAPYGTYGKDPHEISNENNFSMYAALGMLKQVLQDSDPRTAERVEKIQRGIKSYIREYTYDRKQSVFYQGGLYEKGEFRPSPLLAVDCQTWAVNSMGPEWIDETFGHGTVHEIWQATKNRAGFYDGKNELLGVGFTDSRDILTVEWTCGAILSARLAAKFYEGSDPEWAKEFDQDAKSMRMGIDNFKIKLEDGSEAYLYSNKRVLIPWGWWGNPIPSLAASTWVILTDTHFNPFVLGGGEEFRKTREKILS